MFSQRLLWAWMLVASVVFVVSVFSLPGEMSTTARSALLFIAVGTALCGYFATWLFQRALVAIRQVVSRRQDRA